MERSGTTAGLPGYLAERVTGLAAQDVDLEEALARTFSIVGLNRQPIEDARAICAEQEGMASARAVRLLDVILSLSMYRPRRQMASVDFEEREVLHAS